MWNFLIVLLIAVIVWAFNPFKSIDLSPTSTHVDKKTQTEVNQVVDQATQQVDYARKMQQQEQQQENNNANNSTP